MTCKGKCDYFRAPKPLKIGRYASGQKRCQICHVFVITENSRCPCCNYNLRTKPRGGLAKRRYNESVRAKN